MAEYLAPYRAEQCHEDGHVDGCPGKAGGDHEYVKLPLNAMRCAVCGHRLDDMGGCDSCAFDRWAESQSYERGDDDAD